MLIPYTTEDTNQGATQSNSNWWDGDRIVSCLRHRPPISGRARTAVRNYEDAIGASTSIKHYIPWSRINNQLVRIMTTMGTDDGQGMTRSQSVAYLKLVLTELELGAQWNQMVSYESHINDNWEAVGLREPKPEPGANRYSYDIWVSWAVDSICDWSQNLFQAPSVGDGGGTMLDEPVGELTIAIRLRICKAALQLKLTIPGLKIASRESDPEYGWACGIDKKWAEGCPVQSRFNFLTNDWYLPIYHREGHPNEDERRLAAPEKLLVSDPYFQDQFRQSYKGVVFILADGSWGFR